MQKYTLNLKEIYHLFKFELEALKKRGKRKYIYKKEPLIWANFSCPRPISPQTPRTASPTR